MSTTIRLAAAGLALTALLAPASASAQSGEGAVLEVVETLFDAMRAADTARMRSTFHTEVALWSAGERDGAPSLEKVAIERWLEAVGRPHDDVYDERLWGEEVRIDGRLATVWTHYAFFVGERFSHCGVDAFQLFRSEEGWKIFHVADTRRRECDLPSEVSGG